MIENSNAAYFLNNDLWVCWSLFQSLIKYSDLTLHLNNEEANYEHKGIK